MPEQARATNAPAVDCDIRKATQAETALETKPAVQSQAKNTVDVDEIQGMKMLYQDFARLRLAPRHKVEVAY